MPSSTVSGSLKLGDTTYEYCETKTSNAGGGPRGIDIWVKGQKGRKSYQIDPNPHDNSKNYPKNSTDFYARLGEALAKKREQGSDFPNRYGAKWKGESYIMS